MIKLQDLKLSDILPERLKTDEILALANALDGELQAITKAIEEVIMMPRISKQPEDIIDSLAWQLHVDFYEPLGLDLDKKRALVENSLLWHKHKGTKYVVEEMMRTLFFPEFWIEEWFEYGGRPYFFRCRIGSQPMSEEELAEAISALNTVKNERSWLDYIIFSFEMEPSTLYIGGALTDERIAETFIDEPSAEIKMDVYIAGALSEEISETFFDKPLLKLESAAHIVSTISEAIFETFLPDEPATAIESTLYHSFVLDELTTELYEAADPPLELVAANYTAIAFEEFIEEEF